MAQAHCHNFLNLLLFGKHSLVVCHCYKVHHSITSYFSNCFGSIFIIWFTESKAANVFEACMTDSKVRSSPSTMVPFGDTPQQDLLSLLWTNYSCWYYHTGISFTFPLLIHLFCFGVNGPAAVYIRTGTMICSLFEFTESSCNYIKTEIVSSISQKNKHFKGQVVLF